MKQAQYQISTTKGRIDKEGYVCRHSAFCQQEQIGRITWYAVTHLESGLLVGYIGGRKNVEAFCREFDQIPDIARADATNSDNKSPTKMALSQLAKKYKDAGAFVRNVSEACDISLGVAES